VVRSHVGTRSLGAALKILACGGRSFGEIPRETPIELRAEAQRRAELERAWLTAALDEEAARREAAGTPICALAHGGASGADRLAGAWATARGLEVEVFEAGWEAYGRSAGPRRNERMLRDFVPDLVVAFPGGRGTADMVRRARGAGVLVWVCASPPVAV